MRKSLLGWVVLGASLASPVMAAGKDEGFFGSNSLRVGVGIGMNYVSADDITFDERATALEIFGGYEFNRWFALEGGYLNGGDATADFLNGADRLETSALYATAVGSLPVTDALSFYARAGMMQWDAEFKRTLDGAEFSRVKDDGTEPLLGIGAAANLDGALIRLEYRIADLDGTDIEVISLAVVWRFPLSR